MDRFERAERAVALKHGGYNCCQAVTAAFGDLMEVPEELLRSLTAGFGGGMGCMESTCGALIGAVLAAGRIQDGRGTVRTAAKLHRTFADKCGASICKDLKGRDTGKVLCPCDDCVRNAVQALCETLDL